MKHYDPFAGQASIDPRDEGASVKDFPRHLYIPSEAQSIDIRSLGLISAGATEELLRFKAPPGGKTYFYGYALFNDALLFNDVQFIPTVDGSRILPFHGTPLSDNRYRLSLGVGPDISNSSLINCAVGLEPGQTLLWRAENNAAVDVVMGVRMTGYLDPKGFRKQSRVGG